MNSQRLLVLIALVFMAPLEATLLPQSANATETPPSLPLTQARPRRSTAITFNPPRRGAPPATVGLGSRGDCIENRGESLRAVIPASVPSDTTEGSTLLGLTTMAQPTFFVYVPTYHDSAQALSLRVMRVAGDREVEQYSQTFVLPPTSGIVSLRPAPSALPPLEPGEQYHWYVSMVCNSVDQSGNAVVDGWIEHTDADATLLSELGNADPMQRAVLYAQAGIWHDTLLTLAELYRAQPNDPTVKASWQDLLRSVGLGAIAEAPLLECCQPIN